MADKPSEKNGRFDTGLIRELAAILREADLGEIEIEQGGTRIKVVKPESRCPDGGAGLCTRRCCAPPHRCCSRARHQGIAARPPGAVKSPMVGTVYLQAEEGAKKFVTVGDTVAAGRHTAARSKR
jgi:acetyl-CoA carboxylase biotin carboxyl carrier protein